MKVLKWPILVIFIVSVGFLLFLALKPRYEDLESVYGYSSADVSQVVRSSDQSLYPYYEKYFEARLEETDPPKKIASFTEYHFFNDKGTKLFDIRDFNNGTILLKVKGEYKYYKMN